MSSIEHMLGEERARALNEGVGGKFVDPAKPLQVQADVYRVAPRSKVVLGTRPAPHKQQLDCVNFR